MFDSVAYLLTGVYIFMLELVIPDHLPGVHMCRLRPQGVFVLFYPSNDIK